MRITRVFPSTGGMAGAPPHPPYPPPTSHQPKMCSFPHLEKPLTKSLFPHPKGNAPLNNNSCFNPILSCSHWSCTMSFLSSNSLYSQVMVIWILINVQYLQNFVFSFKKGSNDQKLFSSDSHHPITTSKISHSPTAPGRSFPTP